MVLRVIDTETTGLSPNRGAELIQIASIDLKKGPDGRIVPTNPMKTFVRPLAKIPPELSAVHHIIDADVEDAPPLGDAIAMFQGADVYIAHNAAFDRGFLYGLQVPKWVCTLKVAKRVWADAGSHKNQALRYMLGLVEPFGLPRAQIQAHEALSDVYVTGAIFGHIIDNNLATFAQMLEWSGLPEVINRFPIGKHKGKRLADIDADYLSWVVAKSDLDEDIKRASRAELEKRIGKAA
jgi:exodeoxyribonuclease X